MNATLQVRAGASADTDRILELVRLSLGEGVIPRAREYWEWKHHANPFGHSPVLLAEADGELVGLRVFMRWEWSAGSQRLRAVRAVDTATHPAWQGQGIFSRLTRALVQQMTDEGVHFIFNTPNEKSRPGYLKMGWRALGRTDLWIRPLHPLHLLRTLAKRGARTTERQARRRTRRSTPKQPCRRAFNPAMARSPRSASSANWTSSLRARAQRRRASGSQRRALRNTCAGATRPFPDSATTRTGS